MIGDKLQLLFWEAPQDGNDWFLELSPNGRILLRFLDPKTQVRGRIVIEEDSDILFAREVLLRLGYTEKGRHDAV